MVPIKDKQERYIKNWLCQLKAANKEVAISFDNYLGRRGVDTEGIEEEINPLESIRRLPKLMER